MSRNGFTKSLPRGMTIVWFQTSATDTSVAASMAAYFHHMKINAMEVIIPTRSKEPTTSTPVLTHLAAHQQ